MTYSIVAEFCYADCKPFVLSVIWLSVVRLIVIRLIDIDLLYERSA
jgi:hypothetical protein